MFYFLQTDILAEGGGCVYSKCLFWSLNPPPFQREHGRVHYTSSIVYKSSLVVGRSWAAWRQRARSEERPGGTHSSQQPRPFPGHTRQTILPPPKCRVGRRTTFSWNSRSPSTRKKLTRWWRRSARRFSFTTIAAAVVVVEGRWSRCPFPAWVDSLAAAAAEVQGWSPRLTSWPPPSDAAAAVEPAAVAAVVCVCGAAGSGGAAGRVRTVFPGQMASRTGTRSSRGAKNGSVLWTRMTTTRTGSSRS